MSPFPVGVTLSHPHLAYLNIPLPYALDEYGSLGLRLVRLGCYWNEVEQRKGQYDYSVIKNILEKCSELRLKVIMTVGMKAPRWPEYYFPTWLSGDVHMRKNGTVRQKTLQKPLFAFIDKTIHVLKTYDCITHWQVENEPLDPSGPLNLRIQDEILREEVRIVRRLDPSRPIVINLWGNELRKRNLYSRIAEYADVIGFDLYPRVPSASFWKWEIYAGPRDTDDAIRSIISSLQKKGKKVWITELQAEPWGRPQSCTPEHIVRNTRWVSNWKLDGVFFWGFEYWLKEKMNGNVAYWDAVRKALRFLSA